MAQLGKACSCLRCWQRRQVQLDADTWPSTQPAIPDDCSGKETLLRYTLQCISQTQHRLSAFPHTPWFFEVGKSHSVVQAQADLNTGQPTCLGHMRLEPQVDLKGNF